MYIIKKPISKMGTLYRTHTADPSLRQELKWKITLTHGKKNKIQNFVRETALVINLNCSRQLP